MKKIVIDFQKISSEEELNHFLATELDLSARVNGEYGYNLSAFWDTYSYSQDEDIFELVKTKEIAEKNLADCLNTFIEILKDLKSTNPNFDYKIIS